MYLNTNHHQHHGSLAGSKHGTIMTNELSSSSSAMIPLKPDVIREHKDHSSIYYRMSSSSPNDYSTPHTTTQTNRSTPIYSTDTTPVVYTVEPGRSLRLAAASRQHHNSYDRSTADAPSLLSRTTGPTTPSTTEESVSSSLSTDSSESSKRDSTRSSRSFEENIDEYLEPEQPDLSKPQQRHLKSSNNSPTNL